MQIRRLTPRERLRLMGFDDDFQIVVSDTQMKYQTGNSIVVDVMEAILAQIDWNKALEEQSKYDDPIYE